MNMESSSADKVCGIAVVGDSYKYIVQPLVPDFGSEEDGIKELWYSTEFNEIEIMFGFKDLDIIEVDTDDQRLEMARLLLSSDSYDRAIVFLKDGFLVITDLLFFSGYTRIGNEPVVTAYTTPVETATYEDEEAFALIEEDPRLM